LPRAFLQKNKTFGEVSAHLESALSASGYLERSYFSVPGGIAVVTRLERIHANGSPYSDPNRWVSGENYENPLSISEYLRRLFAADEGFYRVVVFIISSEAFSANDRSISPNEAKRWIPQGLNVLPSELAQEPISLRHNCTALIYEFRKAHGKDPQPVVPSSLSGERHLAASGLYSLLFYVQGGSR
jgi:hypothetical protein